MPDAGAGGTSGPSPGLGKGGNVVCLPADARAMMELVWRADTADVALDDAAIAAAAAVAVAASEGQEVGYWKNATRFDGENLA